MKAWIGKYSPHSGQKRPQHALIVEFLKSDHEQIHETLGLGADTSLNLFAVVARAHDPFGESLTSERDGVMVRAEGQRTGGQQVFRLNPRHQVVTKRRSPRPARVGFSRADTNFPALVDVEPFGQCEVEAWLCDASVHGGPYLFIPFPLVGQRRPPRQMVRGDRDVADEPGHAPPLDQRVGNPNPCAEQFLPALKVSSRTDAVVLVDMGDGSSVLVRGVPLARRFKLVADLRAEGFELETDES